MKYVIRRGRHRARPITLKIWYSKSQLVFDAYFDTSCKYDIDGEDMSDTNKLFGIGYLPSHRRNSARFGWRYNPQTEKIVLSTYVYDRGIRLIEDLCEIPFFKKYRLILSIQADKYVFFVIDNMNKCVAKGRENKNHNIKLSYALGPWFGGNKKAPHTMELELTRLKPPK